MNEVKMAWHVTAIVDSTGSITSYQSLRHTGAAEQWEYQIHVVKKLRHNAFDALWSHFRRDAEWLCIAFIYPVYAQTVDTGFHWGPAYISYCYKHVCTIQT